MPVSLFLRKELADEREVNPTLDALIEGFKKYKNGEVVHYFGKDVPFHEPRPYAERAKLKHVHVLDRVKSVKIKGVGTSDSFLIYTEASMRPDALYVIDFIADGAHAKARDPKYMNWLIDKAEAFRAKV